MRYSFAALILGTGLALSSHAALISPLNCVAPGSTAGVVSSGIHANSCTDYSGTTQGVSNWFYGFYGPSGPGPQTEAGNYTPSAFTLMTPVMLSGVGQGFWALDFYHYWTAIGAYSAHSNSVYTDLHDAPFCDPYIGAPYGTGGNCGSGMDPTNPQTAPTTLGGPDSVNQWAVRRYVVPAGFTGLVDISFSGQKDPRTSSPLGDGVFLYGILYHNGIASTFGTVSVGNIDTAVHTMTAKVSVTSGDYLDFVMDPKTNDYSDGTFELITINGDQQGHFDPVPEPVSLTLVGAGLSVLGLLHKRRSAA